MDFKVFWPMLEFSLIKQHRWTCHLGVFTQFILGICKITKQKDTKEKVFPL